MKTKINKICLIIIIFILFILLLWLIDKCDKLKGGGGADDMGKIFIGIIMGAIDNLTMDYNKRNNSIKILNSINNESFMIMFGKIKRNFNTTNFKTLINTEFNEDFNIHHRIKNIYTFLYLMLIIIYTRYDISSHDKIRITYNSNNDKFILKFYTGNILSKTIVNSKQDYKNNIDIININLNYMEEDGLFNLYKQDEMFLLLYNELFKTLLGNNITYSENSILGQKIKNKILNLNNYDNIEYHNKFGFLTTKNKNIYSITKTYNENYGFNIIKYTFNETFDLVNDFDALLRKIVELNGVKINLIQNIVNNNINPDSYYKACDFIIKDEKSYTFNKSDEYHTKLIKLLQHNSGYLDLLKSFNITPDLLCIK